MATIDNRSVISFFTHTGENIDGSFKPLCLQRNYEWGKPKKKSLDLLLEKFKEAFDNKEQYNIDEITVCPDNDNKEGRITSSTLLIADGFQRTISIMIILSTIRRHIDLKSSDNPIQDSKVMSDLNRCIFNDNENSCYYDKPRLQFLDKTINDYFIEYIINGKDIPANNIPKTWLKNGRKVVEDWIVDLKEDNVILRKIANFIMNEVNIDVRMEQTAKKAKERFIRINMFGEALSTESMIKTSCLNSIPSSDPQYDIKFNNIVDTWDNKILKNLEYIDALGNTKYYIEPVEFLRYYLFSKGIKSFKVSVFDDIQNELTKASDVTKVLDDIHKYSIEYRDIVTGQKNNKRLNALRNMTSKTGIRSSIPILLAATKLSQSNYDELVWRVEKIRFVDMIVGNNIKMEGSEIIDVCKRLSSDDCNEHFNEITKILDSFLDSHRNEFIIHFKGFHEFGNTGTKRAKTFYILTLMGYALDGLNHDTDEVEHWLARSRGKEYHSGMIGNYLLLPKSKNAAANNGTPIQKYSIYSGSGIPAITSSMVTPIITATTNTKIDKALNHFPYETKPFNEWKDTEEWIYSEIEARTEAYSKLVEYLFFDMDKE